MLGIILIFLPIVGLTILIGSSPKSLGDPFAIVVIFFILGFSFPIMFCLFLSSFTLGTTYKILKLNKSE